MAISMLKIRRPLGRLIFNVGIAIPGKTVFLIETAPRWFPCNWWVHFLTKRTHHDSMKFSWRCVDWSINLSRMIQDPRNIFENVACKMPTFLFRVQCVNAWNMIVSKVFGTIIVWGEWVRESYGVGCEVNLEVIMMIAFRYTLLYIK